MRTIAQINQLRVVDVKQILIGRIGKKEADITEQEFDQELLAYKSMLRSEVKRTQFKDVYQVMADNNIQAANPALWLEQQDEATLDQLLAADGSNSAAASAAKAQRMQSNSDAKALLKSLDSNMTDAQMKQAVLAIRDLLMP